MHDIVDLRSDTVTKPTSAMRMAMAEAVVGDDVLGDDPTVAALEKMAAERMGKGAALFVPSGSMANNIAIRVRTRPGDEVLLDWDAHSLCYEVGGPAALSGALTRQFKSVKGVPVIDDVASAIRQENLHSPGTALLVLENTHNRAGGAVIPLEVHRTLYGLAKEHGIFVHIDGARIFNASVASGIPASDYSAEADSISFCLSKGLSCPVGSLLCGDASFIEKARRVRKLFGGGMRQAGVLAACGIVAMDTMIDRLAEDHKNAADLASGLSDIVGITVEDNPPQTNMVYIQTQQPATEVVEKVGSRAVLCLPTGPRRIRLVTHHDVDSDDINTAINVFKETATA